MTCMVTGWQFSPPSPVAAQALRWPQPPGRHAVAARALQAVYLNRSTTKLAACSSVTDGLPHSRAPSSSLPYVGASGRDLLGMKWPGSINVERPHVMMMMMMMMMVMMMMMMWNRIRSLITTMSGKMYLMETRLHMNNNNIYIYMYI